MNLRNKIAYNALSQFVGKIGGTVLGLAAVAVMTRYLGPDGFGQYTIVVAFASIFAIMADLGLTLVTSQLINGHDVNEAEVVANLLSFRLLSGTLIIGLAPLLVWFFPYNETIKISVAIAALGFFFISLNQIFVGVLQKYLKTQWVAVAELVSRAVLVAGLAWAALGQADFYIIVWLVTIANFISLLIHYLATRRLTKISWSFSAVWWRRIFSLSWPLMLTVILNLVYLKADIFFLSLMKSQGEVGLYGAAYKVVDVLVALPFMLAGLVLPLLVKYHSAGDKDDWRATAQALFNSLAIGVWPFLIGGWLLARPLMKLVAGPEFLVAGPILNWLLPAVGAVFFSCFFTHLMISLNAQKKMIVYFLLTAVTAVPIYYFLIQQYSYFGAAAGTVYSEVLILVFSIWAVWRQAHYRPLLGQAFRALVAAFLMGLVITLFKPAVDPMQTSGLLFLLVIGVVSYGAALWLLGVKEFNSLFKRAL